MEKSLLRKIPAELRNNIYELVLGPPKTIHCYRKIDYEIDKDWFACHDDDGSICETLVLLQTCREIRHEAAPMFYGLHAYEYEASFAKTGSWSSEVYRVDLQRCCDWLQSVGTRNAAAISRFTISFAANYSDSLDNLPIRWWDDQREPEQAVLHPLLAPSVIFVKASFLMQYSEIGFHHSPSCHLPALVKLCETDEYTLPTSDTALARNAILATYRDKVALMHDYVKHHACCVSRHVPGIQKELRKGRSYLLQAVAGD